MEKIQLDRVIKSPEAHFDEQKHFSENFGTEPKAVHWIYTSIVRPTLTHTDPAWWLRVSFKTSKAKLNKLQTMADLANTGAIKTVSAAAVKVPISLLSLHLQ
jgi:UV DNA damage repair endonuclease